jgi:HEPN domain-containing protein
MPTRKELQALAKLRLKEAETLFAAGMYDGVAYLSGYVIELALKARICRLLNVDDYPTKGNYAKVYAVHDFDQLRFLAGLGSKIDVIATPNLFANWSLAAPWGPERRYAPKGTYSKKDAEDMLNAIRNKNDGLLTWIKRYW